MVGLIIIAIAEENNSFAKKFDRLEFKAFRPTNCRQTVRIE
jgi:hypothetical protein